MSTADARVTSRVRRGLSLRDRVLIGFGASVMFPLTMSAAAQLPKRSAAINVAALSQTSFVAFLAGPPILGFFAEHFGTRSAFIVCLPFVVLVWFFLPALAPNRHEAG